ncbi:ABC transporter ATP-binding protein/permease [Chelatococcus reniformis]|uniref:ABC transporter permease n=1 Tax=Chelatococcus reniformis TaxID=1494448 RepID=A0A916UHD6_9HYPH|nr:SbmA/BacA-like family transporter [Chelatococcus reniformis]GGC71955.1 ABC transporter permease [Chelatococcus reniformis]
MRALAARLWRLVVLCVKGPGGRLGLVYFAAILALNFVGIQITLRLIAWNADFYNALQKLDAGEAVRQMGIFAIIIGINSAQFLIASYIRKLLQIRWRHALTSVMLDRWLADKVYWHLNYDDGAAVDNPDQRIAEDCRLYVNLLTGEALELITTLAGLASYVALLWQLSSFPLAFGLFGMAIEIPRYMVWAAPIYVAVSSGVTHLLGARLMRLTVEQQHREADFRFALTRLRQSTEAVGLADGEAVERRILDRRFGGIVANWRRLINQELLLGCFTRPYMATVLRIPVFLALPAYLAGQVTLGGLMQLGSAFQNVVTSLSWFIFSYRDLAELAAASRRLDGFLDRIDAIASRPPTIARRPSGNSTLRLSGLTLDDPAGRELARVPALVITKGEAVWLRGRSGIGKSTALKAVAGLWRAGGGTIEMPGGTQMFLPQQPYLPLADLRAAALYPRPADGEALTDGARLLALVGLAPRAEAASLPGDDPDQQQRSLSGGEQQRVALARVLANRPDWVFMDEATSALDQAAEEQLLALLRRELPHATFVVVAHREPRGLGPLTIVDFDATMAASTEPVTAGRTPTPHYAADAIPALS